MQRFFRLATAAAAIMFIVLPAISVLAQNAPTKATETTTAPPTATSSPADAKPATAAEQAAGLRKKKVRKINYRQDRSDCPWPSSYGKSGHREYQHCVPFDQLWGTPLK